MPTEIEELAAGAGMSVIPAKQVTFWRLMVIVCLVMIVMITQQAMMNKKHITALEKTVYGKVADSEKQTSPKK